MRSMPNTSQSTPSSKGVTWGRTATATLVSTPSGCHTRGGKSTPASSPPASSRQLTRAAAPTARGCPPPAPTPPACPRTPPRAVGGQRGTAARSRSTCSGVLASPALTRTAVPAVGSLSSSRVSTQDVRAELAGPHPDAVLGRQGRRHEVAVEPVDGEGDDPTALGVVAEERVGGDAVDAAQARRRAARSAGLVVLDAARCARSVAQAAARAMAPSTLGLPASWRAAPVRPRTPRSVVPARWRRRRRGRASRRRASRGARRARRRRTGRRACGRRSATQSTSSASRSTARCGAQLRGVEEHPGAVPRAIATSRSTGHSSPVTFEAPATTTSRGPAGGGRERVASSASASRVAAGDGQAHLSRRASRAAASRGARWRRRTPRCRAAGRGRAG